MDHRPEWVIYNEFVLTSKNYIRTVTETKAEWLLEVSPPYYDLSNYPNCEGKRVLEHAMMKMSGKNSVHKDTGGNRQGPNSSSTSHRSNGYNGGGGKSNGYEKKHKDKDTKRERRY